MDSFQVGDLRLEGNISKHSQKPRLRYFWSLLYRETSTFDQLITLELIHVTKTNRIILMWMLDSSVAFSLQYFRTLPLIGK